MSKSLGGGKQEGDTTTSANPLVQGSTMRVLQEGWDAYDNMPETPGFYQGSTVAGLSRFQQEALNRQMQLGRNGTEQEAGLNSYILNQLGQNYGGDYNAAQGGLGQMARGGMGLGAASQFAQRGSAPWSAALGQQASGAINPLTAQMYQQAAGNLNESFQEGVVPGINATFAQGGRTGSGAQADALGNAAGELGDAQAQLAAQMFGGAAESALGRQLTAAQAGLGNALGQNQLASSMYDSGQNRQLGALGQMLSGSLGGMGVQQGAAGMTGLSSQLNQNNLQNMLSAGQTIQDQDQREIDAKRERYEYESSRGLQDYQRRLGTLGALTGFTQPLQNTGSTSSNSKNAGIGK